MQKPTTRLAQLGQWPLALGWALLIAACGPTGPEIHSPSLAPAIDNSQNQRAQQRVIVQFSALVDAQSPDTLAMLSTHSNAKEVRYVRSLSADTHLYTFTLPSPASGQQLLRELKAVNGIRAVELDQKAFEQSP
ncbi:hypothetical protein [Rhodoferax sp.]|uniref:hypothetical protein n=1 Tax=Rhodoferax sp. TaxID=50421 RepID=UPI002ACE7AD7|nr:hypothetical protein [Rhodoferax sp.]MDZ7921709.1 hypothetical protein [Rhodoferax sp.]